MVYVCKPYLEFITSDVMVMVWVDSPERRRTILQWPVACAAYHIQTISARADHIAHISCARGVRKNYRWWFVIYWIGFHSTPSSLCENVCVL